MELLLIGRDFIFAPMYKILRSILFFFPAEGVHHFSMKGLRILCAWSPLRRLVKWSCQPEAGSEKETAGSPVAAKTPAKPGAQATVQVDAQAASKVGAQVAAPPPPHGLEREVFGLRFANPVGLGAGFDKNALYLRELETLGFGSVEIGTVTPKPQAGNEQPRLFRLPQDEGLINRMGFNNEGMEAITTRLKAWRSRGKSPMIIGGNIGKNKVTPNEDAWKDYELCFRALYDVVDYFVVNVSSPNTPGLRELQEKDALRKILTNLQTINKELGESRPLLLKIAPDLNQQQLDDVVSLALEIQLDGLVATNTTISREGLVTPGARLEAIGAGGVSGAPVKERATEVVRYLVEKTGGQIPVIASGGVFTAADAREKIDAGASLVQVWTGFIYEGPFIIRRICSGI